MDAVAASRPQGLESTAEESIDQQQLSGLLQKELRVQDVQGSPKQRLKIAALSTLLICVGVAVCSASQGRQQALRKKMGAFGEGLIERYEGPRCGKSGDICQPWEDCECYRGGCGCKVNATYKFTKNCSSYICTTTGYVKKTSVEPSTQPDEDACCEPRDCSAYYCPSGYVLKPDASGKKPTSLHSCCDNIAEETKCCYGLCGCPPFKHSWCGLSHCWLNYTEGEESCQADGRAWCA